MRLEGVEVVVPSAREGDRVGGRERSARLAQRDEECVLVLGDGVRDSRVAVDGLYPSRAAERRLSWQGEVDALPDGGVVVARGPLEQRQLRIGDRWRRVDHVGDAPHALHLRRALAAAEHNPGDRVLPKGHEYADPACHGSTEGVGDAVGEGGVERDVERDLYEVVRRVDTIWGRGAHSGNHGSRAGACGASVGSGESRRPCAPRRGRPMWPRARHRETPQGAPGTSPA